MTYSNTIQYEHSMFSSDYGRQFSEETNQKYLKFINAPHNMT